MHSPPPNACSSSDPNAQPEHPHILIAIGNFGRQVLWEQDALLSGFALRVLVVRRTPKPMRQIADIVLNYDRHHAEIWPELRCLIDRAGSVGLVAAAGGVAGSMLTLRLAQEACWANKRVTVALSTPFSWEERRRYWRSIYVLARLRQLGGCDLSVVHTSRMEAMALPGELLRTTLFRLTRQAALGLVGGRVAIEPAPS
jgi:hypothetical protein